MNINSNRKKTGLASRHIEMADTQIVADSKHVKPQYVEMMVPLYSYGCERKVKKALSHLKGIYSVMVDYNQQKVTVWGICNKYDVLSTMRRKRKEARFWEEDNIVVQMEQEEKEEKIAMVTTFFSTNEGMEKGLQPVIFFPN